MSESHARAEHDMTHCPHVIPGSKDQEERRDGNQSSHAPGLPTLAGLRGVREGGVPRTEREVMVETASVYGKIKDKVKQQLTKSEFELAEDLRKFRDGSGTLSLYKSAGGSPTKPRPAASGPKTTTKQHNPHHQPPHVISTPAAPGRQGSMSGGLVGGGMMSGGVSDRPTHVREGRCFISDGYHMRLSKVHVYLPSSPLHDPHLPTSPPLTLGDFQR